MRQFTITCMFLAVTFMCVGAAQAGLFDAEIVSMSLSGDINSEPFELRLSMTDPSLGIANPTSLGGGLYHIDSFFDVFTELSVDGGDTWVVGLTGPVEAILPEVSNDTAGTFDTEIVSMSLSGNVSGTPVIVRESPTVASPGSIDITDLGGGLYHIDSFFDVFTELSVDGGESWSTGPRGTIVTRISAPEPGSMAFLLGAGIMLLIRMRRRR